MSSRIHPLCRADKVVVDGRHNAFAAFAKWKGQYWLAFRKGAATLPVTALL